MNYRGTIAFRTAVGGTVESGFCASLVAAWDYMMREFYTEAVHDENPNVHFMQGLSCMLHDSANQIADGFLGDWVLFLDTDHVFGAGAFYEMITTFEDNNLDILSGFAQKRQPPYTPLIFKTNFDPLKNFEPIIPHGLERHTVIPIDASGLGCTLVRRRVFDAIAALGERPFDFRYKFASNFLPHMKERPINTSIYQPEMSRYLSGTLPEGRRWDEFYWEDVSFYWRAAILGFKSYCAPWIKFHHIEKRLVTDNLIQAPAPLDPRIPA